MRPQETLYPATLKCISSSVSEQPARRVCRERRAGRMDRGVRGVLQRRSIAIRALSAAQRTGRSAARRPWTPRILRRAAGAPATQSAARRPPGPRGPGATARLSFTGPNKQSPDELTARDYETPDEAAEERREGRKTPYAQDVRNLCC